MFLYSSKTDCASVIMFSSLKIGDEIKYNDSVIGRILIDKPYPFALIKLFDPEFSVFKDKKLKIKSNNVEIISWKTLMKILIGPVNTLGI